MLVRMIFLKKDLIEIWGDLVSQKDLLLSLSVSSLCTLGAYFFAPKNTTSQLFFGLGGAVVGFIIITLLITPKRHVKTTATPPDTTHQEEQK